MNDWMDVIRSPVNIRYRVNNTVNLKVNSFKYIVMPLTFIFIVLSSYFILSSYDDKSGNNYKYSNYLYRAFDDGKNNKLYNSIYPLSLPIVDKKERTKTYDIMAIADLDTESKFESGKDTNYVSYILKGKLTLHDNLRDASIDFDTHPVEITTQYSYGDRGMELSELIIFNGKILSCDDRTGIIFEIKKKSDKYMAIPWVILVDGDGESTSKGFKCEWMTVKDQKLYVGGLGKEWTTSKGVLVNHNPQWVKVVGHLGDVYHIDWKDMYESIRKEGGFTYPGYMIFESCVWNNHERKWYFLPRRASKESYDEVLDEKRGTNLLISADENFAVVTYRTIGHVIPARGYSSFKFVPNTNERLVLALKSEEDSGRTRTFITLFDKEDGTILIKDKLISEKFKYEGIEFV